MNPDTGCEAALAGVNFFLRGNFFLVWLSGILVDASQPYFTLKARHFVFHAQTGNCKIHRITCLTSVPMVFFYQFKIIDIWSEACPISQKLSGDGVSFPVCFNGEDQTSWLTANWEPVFFCEWGKKH